MVNKSNLAVQKFVSGFNCAQSVLLSFNNEFNIGTNTASRISTGFGAGMGRKQEVCGAVTGGIIILGLKYGRGEKDDHTATEKTYIKTRELFDAFIEKHGTVICRDLLNGCDLLTPEGQKYFKENDLFNNTCKKCVQSVIKILEEI